MSNLVRSTYEQLFTRLQRGGTQAEAAPHGGLVFQSMGFNVFKDGSSTKESFIRVDVAMWHQKNVYTTHDDKVQITLSHLSGQQSQFTFFPRIGNCPPLDKVESKVREALEHRVLNDVGDAQREASKQNNERLADQECPKPPSSTLHRVRGDDGTYTVTGTFYCVLASAVRQLFEIESSRDAVGLPVQLAPDVVAVPAPEPPKPPKRGKLVQIN